MLLRAYNRGKFGHTAVRAPGAAPRGFARTVNQSSRPKQTGSSSAWQIGEYVRKLWTGSHLLAPGPTTVRTLFSRRIARPEPWPPEKARKPRPLGLALVIEQHWGQAWQHCTFRYKQHEQQHMGRARAARPMEHWTDIEIHRLLLRNARSTWGQVCPGQVRQ